jgi:DNA topoisomerase IA
MEAPTDFSDLPKKMSLARLLNQYPKTTKFVYSSDYDPEGEVIGYNILQYVCDNK